MNNKNEIVRFDPEIIKKKVSAHIKQAFVDLVPDEAWQKLVSDEVDQFLITDARPLIKEIVKRKMMKAIIMELDKPEYNSYWQGSHQKPGVMVSKIVKELAPDLVVSLFGNIVQEITQQIRNNLSSMSIQPY